ncbi:hypothetical protein ACJQWK_00977 [Exserohilum turcicum]
MNPQSNSADVPYRHLESPQSQAEPSTTLPCDQPAPHSRLHDTTSNASSASTNGSTQQIHTPQTPHFEHGDFEDIVTTWGRYSTEELVKSSPYYTKSTIRIDPYAKLEFPEMEGCTERVVHAVHPIPRSYLEDMGPICMHDLGEKLDQERWDVEGDPATTARIQETLARIDDILEFVFCLHLPGTRTFSGREPAKS